MTNKGRVQIGPHAAGIPFEDPNFASTEVQPAIVEARTNAEGFSRAVLSFLWNGSISNGDWISFSSVLADKRIVFPVKTKLKEISWNNRNTGLWPFNLEFYKNGQVDPTNKIYTYTPASGDFTAGFGFHTFSSNVIIDVGDRLYVKFTKTPGNAQVSDLSLSLWVVRSI